MKATPRQKTIFLIQLIIIIGAITEIVSNIAGSADKGGSLIAGLILGSLAVAVINIRKIPSKPTQRLLIYIAQYLGLSILLSIAVSLPLFKENPGILSAPAWVPLLILTICNFEKVYRAYTRPTARIITSISSLIILTTVAIIISINTYAWSVQFFILQLIIITPLYLTIAYNLVNWSKKAFENSKKKEPNPTES